MDLHHRIEFARWVIQENSAATVGGWCASPGNIAIATVEAHVAQERVSVASTEERIDVQRHFNGDPFALRSGFTLHLPFLELETIVELRAVTSAGTQIVFHSFRFGDLPNRDAHLFDYAHWSRSRTSVEVFAKTTSITPTLHVSSLPLLSLLLPVYNTPIPFLRECIDSVLQQTYPKWELQIVDDGSTLAELKPFLSTCADRDPRIRITTLPQNRGISHATNQALTLANGEFVGFVDHDDRLHPRALAEAVERLLSTNAVAVYTDEEKITASGEPHWGFFKPAFSPEFLRGVMYIGHFLCVRTSVARNLGGFNSAYDGIQDFEFALRLSEHTDAIEHIPKILYQWRMSPSSSAQTANIKGDMDKRQAAAVGEHLTRLGRKTSAAPLGGHRVRLAPLADAVSPNPLLIVRDPACIREVTGFEQSRILILSRPTVRELAIMLERSGHDRFVWLNEPLLLESAPVLDPLLELLDDDTVGAVAPVLLASDGKVFASGIVITPDGELIPAMRGFSPNADGYHGSFLCNREVSAVMPSCVAMRTRDLLPLLNESDNPFSETSMAALCFSLQRKKLRIVTCAAVQLPIQRSWANNRTVGKMTVKHWTDPFYNLHFDPLRADYRLAPAPPDPQIVAR